jgi:hypothetical protein
MEKYKRIVWQFSMRNQTPRADPLEKHSTLAEFMV